MKKSFVIFINVIILINFIILISPFTRRSLDEGGIFVSPAYAAKPRLKPAAKSLVKSSGTAISSARLRPDRKAVIVSFLNLNKYSDVTYSLTYTANGIDQGVQGSVSTSGQTSASRELLFGTCSKNVCTYHVGIRNMRLEIIGQNKNGSTVVKKYLIKP